MKKSIYFLITILQIILAITIWGIENIGLDYMTFNRWILYKTLKLSQIPYTTFFIKVLFVLGIIFVAFGIISWIRKEGNRFDAFLLILCSIVLISYGASNKFLESSLYYLYYIMIAMITGLQAIKVFIKKKRIRL